MMDFRKSPGSVVDRVMYLNQVMVVKKAGKPTVGIVPIRELLELQRRRQAAKGRFWRMTQTLRAQFAGVDPEELERKITSALEQVRTKNTP